MTSPENLNKWPGQVVAVLKASWISILIILIIFGLTRLDQSDTIVIDLLDRRPANFLLFVYLLLCLTLIVSHYPTYLEFNRYQSRSRTIRWMQQPILLGWGFVTYEGPAIAHRSRLIGHIRTLWGSLLLWAVFYIFLVTHSRNIDLYLYDEDSNRLWLVAQVIAYMLFCVVCYLLFVRLFTQRRKHWRKVLLTGSLALFAGVFLITLLFTILKGWCRPTYWWMYTLLWVAVPLYTAGRLYRKNTWLHKDLSFVQFIASGGFFSLGVVLYAHYRAFDLNPLVILLAQFILLYGLFVIPIKHYLYYRQPEVLDRSSPFTRLFFVWILPLHIPLLLLWAFITGWIGNDLHQLPTIPEKDTIGFREFVDDFDNRYSEKDTVYFIASFGGGLKATIWNQLILDSLTNYGGHKILSNTVAISGVSGGSIGHAVFAGLYHKDAPALVSHKSEIKKLGEKNFLSVDLTYLLGRDLLLELVPGFLWKHMGRVKDRAKLAMHGYNDFVQGDSALLGDTFRTFWASLYRKEKEAGRFFPAMIGNSAATHIQRGIACSVNMDTLFDSTFFDSTDLLSFRDSTASLPFLYAASCTDRFPIFSPAAKVHEKGHFIDGGYFENSGMLSLQDFYNALRKRSAAFTDSLKRKPPTVVFIQIINGKEEYLKSLLKGPQIKKVEKESSELSSILGTITSISFVPSYLMKKSASDVHYVQIHLPYYLTQNDIRKMMKARKITLNNASLQAIASSNQRIDSMVGADRYRYVQPPLARLLGKQAVNYMEAALARKETWADLNRILNLPPGPASAPGTKFTP